MKSLMIKSFSSNYFISGLFSLFTFFFVTYISIYTTISHASPTAEQIAIFNQLSPEQKEEALKKYKTQNHTNANAAEVTQITTIKPRSPIGDKKIEESAKKSLNAIPETTEKKKNEKFDEIKQFGYDLFAGIPTTFAPATDIPVPMTYVIGPGDNVLIQLYGKENNNYNLVVNREGILQFPSIGPISVAGLSFSELKALLNSRISKQLIGVEASITLGTLRSIRIFVLGEVERPGSYTISALSTMTNALFASGGIANIGSLRNIQLKRDGKIITKMDLYDLLLKGDTSSDQRLMPGDVIFVPPIGKTVGISGEIRRPAIYEIKSEKKVSDIISIAGGLLPTAFKKTATIERIKDNKQRTYLDINLSQGLKTNIQNGDVIKIFSVLDKVEDVVLLKGHVKREYAKTWRKNLWATDLVNKEALLPGADLNYAIIERENKKNTLKNILYLNIEKAIASKIYDIQLQKGDIIHIFPLGSGRSEKLKKITAQLLSEATQKNPAKVVEIIGNVKSPGLYPFHEGMNLKELIYASSDLLPKTDTNYTLIERINGKSGSIEVIQVSIDSLTNNKLQILPGDRITIFDLETDRSKLLTPIIENIKNNSTLESKQRFITISGRVRFTGQYPYTLNMSLQEIINAAGGYLDDAYLSDAEINRYKIIDGKKRELSKLTVNLKNDISRVILKPYDEILVRKIPNWNKSENIIIAGEVKFPGTYTISKDDTLWDVLKRAGGITEYGDMNAAIFTRESLKSKEQEELDRYKKRLDQLLAAEQISNAKSLDKEMQNSISDLDPNITDRIASTEAIGRLIIDLPIIANSNGENGNISLRNGDMIVIPRTRQEVSILGEINFPTSHLYNKNYHLEDYISKSGGFTAKADEDRIYVIKANGAVIANNRTSWFDKESTSISPGDTIVVPYDIDDVSPMVQWSNISRILFQLATTAATLKTVGAF